MSTSHLDKAFSKISSKLIHPVNMEYIQGEKLRNLLGDIQLSRDKISWTPSYCLDVYIRIHSIVDLSINQIY
ncbi:hypothetical protein BGW36DRAFT_381319 [Talaromyces proteolyticus]|uniref:Uncharacterized protein n=1 Tax=Talaromyces proteolyticus TaxID=1131652 RepID=A0AAD4KPZ9_9EURO|nr:uncharacterized protein BGW36DRAFT_381319 [Talaromyces proteolyticus]KAH8696610.1 hypothetical protein BGW36DRAFT_381319 [Talaromyces proteolyticus]